MPKLARPSIVMTEVARCHRQWTRAAVREGRVFFSFPRWSSDVPISVGELTSTGTIRPFPSEDWNDWRPGDSPEKKFICVQSVHFDKNGNLWILDAGNPFFSGVIAQAPKLIRIKRKELETNQNIQINSEDIFKISSKIIDRDRSYPNDVRIWSEQNWAFISDSGAGAMLGINLMSGECRRLLDEHYSVKAEPVILTIDGREWREGDKAPKVHVDGIALSPDCKFLYYQALTGRTLYRIPTACLIDETISAADRANLVETIGVTGAADGIDFGPDARLYLTAIERNAITRLKRRYDADDRESENDVETVLIDDRLEWPDSITHDDGDGSLYVTTSRIHRGSPPTGPFRLFHLQFVDPKKPGSE